MRVLHVYRTYFPDPPGGLQEAIRQTCIALQSRGVENQVLTLSRSPFPEIVDRPEARVVRSRSWLAPASCDIGGPAAVKRFRVAAEWADVVHFNFPWPFADVLRLLAGREKPAVLTYHSDIVRQRMLGGLYRPLMMRMLNTMSAVVATSPGYAKSSEVLCDGAIQDRVRVVPLGIDRDSYPSAGDVDVFRRAGLNSGEPYFLFIGVLRYYKGLHDLVKAATHVPAKIVIAGTGPEGEALRALQSRTNASNVIFAGQVTDEEKVALIRECRALVLPSHLRSEAFGMVLVEAAMFGRPLISCELGTGTSYVNAHQETGFVVPPNRPDELASAMNAFLESERLALQMGAAAFSRYEKLFSGAALGRAYEAVFREVLQR